MTTKQLHEKFQAAIETADFAAMDAVEKASVQPMIVGTPKDPVGSILGGDGGGFDPEQPIYFVADGPCGFAWINMKATGTEGRKFLNWLKGTVKTDRPFRAVQPDATNAPRADSYYGGVSLWVGGFNQSVQRKETYANAFAASLRDAGIEGLAAYGASRLD